MMGDRRILPSNVTYNLGFPKHHSSFLYRQIKPARTGQFQNKKFSIQQNPENRRTSVRRFYYDNVTKKHRTFAGGPSFN